MKRFSELAVNTAAVIVVAASFGTSAFADSRLRDETSSNERVVYQNRDREVRDDERVTVDGRISNITRERDGYRVQVEGDRRSFWVPERSLRGRDFRIGLNIRLGGVFRRGSVYVDVVEYPVAQPRRVYVRGVVDGIDLRRGMLYVRDEFSRHVITVDAHNADRNSRRFDLNDLRRGDAIEVYGDWGARGVLNAYRIEPGAGRRH